MLPSLLHLEICTPFPEIVHDISVFMGLVSLDIVVLMVVLAVRIILGYTTRAGNVSHP